MKFEGRNNSSILDKVSKQNKMNKSKLELRLNLFEFEPKCTLSFSSHIEFAKARLIYIAKFGQT